MEQALTSYYPYLSRRLYISQDNSSLRIPECKECLRSNQSLFITYVPKFNVLLLRKLADSRQVALPDLIFNKLCLCLSLHLGIIGRLIIPLFRISLISNCKRWNYQSADYTQTQTQTQTQTEIVRRHVN